MFHIKSLELVHWDYWQRIKNIPLDAKIITIAGQNGSGKTTLLDALRTLFGLDCSMGRTYKHYARHSGQQTAWLRAVVDNKNIGKQLSNRPFRSSGFFSDDEVTLFCQIQKNGGDWKRQYLMRPGNVQIEDIGEAVGVLPGDQIAVGCQRHDRPERQRRRLGYIYFLATGGRACLVQTVGRRAERADNRASKRHARRDDDGNGDHRHNQAVLSERLALFVLDLRLDHLPEAPHGHEYAQREFTYHH